MLQSEVVRSDDLRAKNRLRLLESMREHGETINRTKLSNVSGLSQSTLTKMCSELTNEGVLTQLVDGNSSKRGRPLSSYSLAADAAVAAIVSITKDRITCALVDYSSNIKHRLEKKICSLEISKTQLIWDITFVIERLLTTDLVHHLMHIEVSIQGPVDSNNGSLIWSPTLPLENVPLSERLTEAFQVPVSVNNDCKYIAHALHSEKRDLLGDSFAAITVSYGVGLGIYLNAEPLKGACSSALEIGHLTHKRNGADCRCGKQGCIEAYAADYAIYRRATNKSADGSRINAETINQLVRSAKAGDSAAIEAFSEAGAAIGTAISTIYSLFDPIPVVLLGHSNNAWSLMAKEFTNSQSATSSKVQGYTHLIHYFDNTDELRLSGLAAASVSQLDKTFARTKKIFSHS